MALAEDAEARIEEVSADTRAMVDAIAALVRADSTSDILREVLTAIRMTYGWEVACYRKVDRKADSLVFAIDGGTVDPKFRPLVRDRELKAGESPSGIAWRRDEPVFVEDLLADRTGPTDRAASSVGLRGVVSLPIRRGTDVIGVLEFASTKPIEITSLRSEALNTIAQTASNKITHLGQEREMSRLAQMVANAPVNMVYADRDLRIRYLNPKAIETLTNLQAHLPIPVEKFVGQSIDIFHKNPERQRTLLSDPSQLPYKGTMTIGPELIDLVASPILDEDGDYLGPMLTWEIVTTKHHQAARESEMLADSNAVNFLLIRLAKANTPSEVIQHALETVREAFGWLSGTYWEVDAEGSSLVFSLDSGELPEEFRAATKASRYVEGQGLSGRCWQQHDLVFVSELSELAGCPRAAVAKKCGVSSALAIPIQLSGVFVGAMDFLTKDRIEPSENRLEVMRSVGRLVSSALDRVDRMARAEQERHNLEEKVNALMNVASAAASGNLRVEVPVQGTDDLGRLGTAMANMIRDLKEIIGQIIESTGQFAEGSQVIAESATYLSESSQSQAATVEEMSASIEQLGRAITEINQNAEAARSQAEETWGLARHGGEAVEQAIEAMGLITKSSEQVSDITQVIGEIASQTNLLALNAAIEAARAGEHGLGFAVVADEVRKLAERSSAAAKEITSLIKESTRRVADGAKLSEKAGQSLATIVKGVEETTDRIGKIARATHEQSESASEVTKAIQDVSGITETNASSSEELSASAEELGAQAESLRQAISGFKV